jgi:peptide/nickel transport system permease protein
MSQLVTEVEQLDVARRPIEGRSPWVLAWQRLRRDRIAIACAVVIVLIVLLALCAPLIARLLGHPLNAQYLTNALSPEGLPRGPNRHFWFGSDDLGRDVLVRVAYGARVSLLAGVAASSAAVLTGVLVGLTAGYFGGAADSFLSRTMDVILSFPFLLFAIALVSLVGPSLGVAIGTIAFFSWAAVGRVVRGQTLSLREREYVEAARSLGAGDLRIMFVDILPNLTATVLVYLTLLIPASIAFEATLSFLGLGVVQPTPSWGAMLNEARSPALLATKPWLWLAPGATISLAVLATNFIGDGLRDAFDVKSRTVG